MRFLAVIAVGGALSGWMMVGGTMLGTVAGIGLAALIGVGCAAMEGR